VRPVNLIPPEDRRGDRAPLRTGPLAYVVVAVLLLAFVGVYALVSTGNSISEGEAEVASLEDQLASSTARAEALQSFSNFATLEQGRNDTVATLAQSRFDWERVLRELAIVIPEDVSLISLSGSITGGATGGSDSGGDTASQGIEAPTLSMDGCASSHESVARMVAALRDIDGVTRVGLESSAMGEDGSGSSGAATPAPADPATGAAGGDCGVTKSTTFDLVVAFDEVQVDPSTGGITPPPAPAPVSGDGSDVAEPEREQASARGEIDSAEDESREAVNRYVPGA